MMAEPTNRRANGLSGHFRSSLECGKETSNPLDQIRRAATESPSHLDSAPSIKTVVSTLVAKRLLGEDKGRYVTLALPANPNL